MASAPSGFQHAHAPLDFADAENRHLRLIDDDGRREQAAAHPVIGDRERAAAHLLRRQLAGAGGRDQPPELGSDLPQAQVLRRVDHRAR